jgi:CDP-6-deoxy-D-xylo-4-hexulose-3-dehydrase
MIPLMKNAFLNERETKEALCDFILNSKMLSMSVECLKFEKNFSIYQKRSEAVLFNSGGSANLALLQALKNLGKIKDNDNIGFSALTWSTNVMPIIQLGMNPVPIDSSPMTLNVMAEEIEKVIKLKKLKALFITNALGFMGDMLEIKKLCEKNNIILLEDNCESLGSVVNDVKSGNFGLASTFSFFVAHHMSTIEGGMVCTDDEELSEMLRMVRANGWDRNLNAVSKFKWRKKYKIDSEFVAKYTFYDLGFNMRPTEITGFLGNYQLQFLEKNIQIRERNYLNIEKLININEDLLSLNHSHIQCLSTFAFPIICKTPKLREKYINRFSGAGIEIRPMIAGNMQNQPFYSKYIVEKYDLKGTDFIQDNGFYCGNYPELTEIDLEAISSCILN